MSGDIKYIGPLETSFDVVRCCNDLFAGFRILIGNPNQLKFKSLSVTPARALVYMQRFFAWTYGNGVFSSPMACLDTRLRHDSDTKHVLLMILQLLQSNLDAVIKLLAELQISLPRDARAKYHLTISDDIVQYSSRLKGLIHGIEGTLDRLDTLSTIISSHFRRTLTPKRQSLEELTARPEHQEGFERVSVILNYTLKLLRDQDFAIFDQIHKSVLLRRARILAGREQSQGVCEAFSADFTVPGIEPSHAPADSMTEGRNENALERSRIQSLLHQMLWATRSSTWPSVDRSLQRCDDDLYPTMPQLASDVNFVRCNICFLELSSSRLTESTWRKHVDQDIEPYICIYDNCESVRTCFSTFAAWKQHMNYTHTKSWFQSLYNPPGWACRIGYCNVSCSVFETREQLETHLIDEHSKEWQKSSMMQKEQFIQSSLVGIAKSDDICLVCGARLTDKVLPHGSGLGHLESDDIVEHIGGDLKRIAFISLHSMDIYPDDGSEIPATDSEGATCHSRNLGSSRSGPSQMDMASLDAFSPRRDSGGYLAMKLPEQEISSAPKDYEKEEDLAAETHREHCLRFEPSERPAPEWYSMEHQVWQGLKQRTLENTNDEVIEHLKAQKMDLGEDPGSAPSGPDSSNMGNILVETPPDDQEHEVSESIPSPATPPTPRPAFGHSMGGGDLNFHKHGKCEHLPSTLSAQLEECTVQSAWDNTNFIPKHCINKVTIAAIGQDLESHGGLQGMRDQDIFPVWRQASGRAKITYLILCRIGHAHTFKMFSTLAFQDDHLPITEEGHQLSDKNNIRHANQLESLKAYKVFEHDYWTKDSSRISEFFRAQWLFLAPVLRSEMSGSFLPNSAILPFVKVEQRPEQISGKLRNNTFQITVARSHCDLPFASLIPLGSETSDLAEYYRLSMLEMRTSNYLRAISRNEYLSTLVVFHRDDSSFVFLPSRKGTNLQEFWGQYRIAYRFNLNHSGRAHLGAWTSNCERFLELLRTMGDAMFSVPFDDLDPGVFTPEDFMLFKSDTRIVKADSGIGVCHVSEEMRRLDDDLRFGKGGFMAKFWLYPPATLSRSRRYSPPKDFSRDTIPVEYRRAWSMGCIFLEFVVWFLWGRDSLKYLEEIDEFWEPDQSCLEGARVHNKVHECLRWIQRMDPRCKPGVPGLGDLLRLVETQLLIVMVGDQLSPANLEAKNSSLEKALQALAPHMSPDERNEWFQIFWFDPNLRFLEEEAAVQIEPDDTAQ